MPQNGLQRFSKKFQVRRSFCFLRIKFLAQQTNNIFIGCVFFQKPIDERPCFIQVKHSAGFGMSFDFSNLRNLAYDVRVRPEGVLVLNTTLAENDLFYGKVYASGSATISGNKNGVNMNIVASTAGNSQFYLPLSGMSSSFFLVSRMNIKHITRHTNHFIF